MFRSQAFLGVAVVLGLLSSPGAQSKDNTPEAGMLLVANKGAQTWA